MGLIFLAASAAWAGSDSGRLSVRPEPKEGFVYFRDSTSQTLKAVLKPFPSGLGPHKLGRAILDALLAGPPHPGLQAVVPADTRVGAFFITESGDAYVDVDLPGGRFERSDTMTEILGIYSLVNSLTVNIPEILRVKILVNGVEGSSLGGHVTLAPFFRTNMLIVK